MSSVQLLDFIKFKLRNYPNEIVWKENGAYLTLKQVFEKLGFDSDSIHMDVLHDPRDTFNRFDRFNGMFQLMNNSILNVIFLKRENLLKGRYLAELTKIMIQSLEDSKYLRAE